MRIITPSGASLLPDGTGSGSFLAASYEFEETVGADFAFVYQDLLIPNDGSYMWSLFVKILNSDSAVGALEVNAWVPFIATAVNQTTLGTVATDSYSGVGQVTGVLNSNGVVQIGRELTGFAGTTLTYRITASAFRLC